ncbi:AMP-binding protein [Maribacter sp. 2304DJ31-5]|uniref:AMP-binding protein n=1 Tax=Maribacter sp. 2304DJ31-5 TaxID=3386273 RepID=UPI0039BC6A3D
MNWFEIHPRFRLNGISFTKKNLAEQVHNFIGEGKDFKINIGNFFLDWLNESPEIVVMTSGSTGPPKKIKLQKQQMVNSARATGNFFDLNPGDRALHCLSSNYIAGKMMLVRGMVLGLELDCVPPGSKPLKNITDTYDFAAMVPLQLHGSLNDIDHVKTLIIGGAPLSQELKKKVRGKNTCIFETYGMTETITHVAVKRINPITKDNCTGKGETFKSLPDIIFSQDDRGCLIIDAPGVSDSKIITNDVVDLFSEKEFQWLGRYDHIINSGGVKLFPERIEALLSPIIPNRFFIAGLPDDKLGTKLVLCIEGHQDKSKLSYKIHQLETLSKYQIPKEILVVPKFLETENGKVNRYKTMAMVGK